MELLEETNKINIIKSQRHKNYYKNFKKIEYPSKYGLAS